MPYPILIGMGLGALAGGALGGTLGPKEIPLWQKILGGAGLGAGIGATGGYAASGAGAAGTASTTSALGTGASAAGTGSTATGVTGAGLSGSGVLASSQPAALSPVLASASQAPQVGSGTVLASQAPTAFSAAPVSPVLTMPIDKGLTAAAPFSNSTTEVIPALFKNGLGGAPVNTLTTQPSGLASAASATESFLTPIAKTMYENPIVSGSVALGAGDLLLGEKGPDGPKEDDSSYFDDNEKAWWEDDDFGGGYRGNTGPILGGRGRGRMFF